MGNFEKLSVLVIGVIIVMILVVAIHTWTTNPSDPDLKGDDAVESATLRPESLDLSQPALSDRDRLDASPDPWIPEDEELGLDEIDDPNRALDTDDAQDADVEIEDGEADASSEDASAPGARKATVRQNDTLGHISQRMYGTTRYWRKIAEANDNLDPQSLQKGMVLLIPHIPDVEGPTPVTPSDVRGAARGGTYTVRSGDTIQKIARAAYGGIERWTDIWFENMETISDPEHLSVGLTIQLPN
jgi:LysM repeat protein